MTTGPTLDRSAPFYVAGHRGLAGSAMVRRLRTAGFSDLIERSSDELDLRDRGAVFDFFAGTRPEYVVLAAARVGGIGANHAHPVDFLSDNLRIQVNVLDAARVTRVRRLLFLGSSCIYPKFAPQPINEDALLSGALEPTNDAYAVAKIAGIMQVRAVRQQDGLSWITAMPTNLYGPNDNFDPDRAHVLPALIRRYDRAAATDAPSVTNWGTGTVRREFLHADDLADACLHLLDHYDDDQHVNVGTGTDVTIAELADMVAAAVGYRGRTEWDPAQPDGTPRKLLNITRIAATGWFPQIGLAEGIAQTVRWFRSQMRVCR